MASCERMNPESDEEEVDLESLRLAALQSLHEKPKFVPVNHNNLIPIVPLNVEPPVVTPKIKLEPISPTLEENIQVDSKFDVLDFEEGDDFEEEEDEEKSSDSENCKKKDQDILSMDDKDEEDSLERLMDQLEAEISGQAPIVNKRTVLSSKQSKQHKEKKKKVKKEKEKDETEVELIEVKLGKQQGEVINLRESKTPEPTGQSGTPVKRNSKSPDVYRSKSPLRRSRTPFRSRSKSPFRRSRSLRSRSPYWSRSPRRSRSPYRRSRSPRSPFWLTRRRSRSPLRKSRSPYRKSRSPFLRKSPLRRFSRSRSRSRSRSYGRRSPSPWYRSPRWRSRSPFLRDPLSPLPRRRDISPERKYRRRTLSPRESSKSPRRSRSPRYLPPRRNSPFRRSKSPFRRSRSRSLRRSPPPKDLFELPPRRSPPRFSRSPVRRSKSPIRRSSSLTRRSKSPLGPSKLPPRNRSKSPGEKFGPANRSRSYSRGRRSLSFSASPRFRRNRSPLRAVEKNVAESNDKNDNEKFKRDSPKDRRLDSRRDYNRRNYKPRGYRRYSPGRDRRSNDKQKNRSKSPDKKAKADEIDSAKEPTKTLDKPENPPVSTEPLDPVLEARKKKFENLGEVDPSVDKKISLKAIKESSENVEDDDDALNINFENDLWDESEESDHENESRFKCADPKKKPNRTVLSFRNLREDGGVNKKINLNKPLLEENPKERFPRNDRFERWPRGRRNDRNDRSDRNDRNDRTDRNDRNDRNFRSRYQNDDFRNKTQVRDDRSRNEPIRNKSQDTHVSRKPDRKVVLSSKVENNSVRDSLVSTTLENDKRTKDKVKENPGKISDKDKLDSKEDDDFDKLMSDFEKELENDLCILSGDSPVKEPQIEEPKISPKKDSKTENRAKPNLVVKKPSEINEIFAPKPEPVKKHVEEGLKEEEEEGEIKESEEKNQPEDYVDDDDFVIEDRPVKRKVKTRINEDDAQSDLRAILSRRRNERLKAVTVQRENVPARLVQSAFQGLKNKKSKHPNREVQNSVDVSSFEMKSSVSERRRVLLVKKDEPTVASVKITVPEETARHRLERSDERRRKRKMQGTKEADQEDEDDGLQSEEKPSRRFRLKRNVTLSSQVQN